MRHVVAITERQERRGRLQPRDNPPCLEAGSSGVSEIPEKVEQLIDRLREPPGLRREMEPGHPRERPAVNRGEIRERGARPPAWRARGIGHAHGAREARDREQAVSVSLTLTRPTPGITSKGRSW